LIERVRRAVEAAEEYIKSRPVDQPMFLEQNHRNEYVADMAAMKVWVDAFQRKS
jgi:hypothetical protein